MHEIMRKRWVTFDKSVNIVIPGVFVGLCETNWTARIALVVEANSDPSPRSAEGDEQTEETTGGILLVTANRSY